MGRLTYFYLRYLMHILMRVLCFYLLSLSIYCILVSYSSVEKALSRGERREARQHNMIQAISTADCIQSFRWRMETCAGHVCLSGHCTIRKIQREKSSLSRTNKLIAVVSLRADRPESGFGRRRVCSGSPGALGPLVSALSDLQIASSHPIMAQAPWIFKEWLSDTCQTSLTRLMGKYNGISETVDWLGQPFS